MKDKFIKLNGKVRQDKKIYTYTDVTDPTFQDDYGRIVPPGYIVFDFDEQPYINIISNIIEKSNLKCKKLITTKGVHFMFKTEFPKISDAIKCFNWIGLKCDIKACGVKEYKQSYQALRVNGKTREEKYLNGATTDEELDCAPKWLYPVKKKKDIIDLTIDQEGNRNNLFHFELMARAKKNGFSYEDYVEQASIINNDVLPKGLETNELNSAIRQEEWDNLELGQEKQFLFAMAQDLIDYWNCIWANEQIAFFNHNTNRYDTNLIVLQGYLLDNYKNENISTSKIKEVLEQVNILLQNKIDYWQERNDEYILCNKELVSVLKNDVMPNTRTIYTNIYYPYSIMTEEEFINFNGRAKSFMEEISCYDKDKNSEILKVIWECIGCMLSPSKPFGKIFIWYGSGANGKSLLLRVIKKIMGDFMTSANILNINDKFALESVINGVANVTDDVGITTLKETGILKSIIQGTSVEVNRKYKNSIWWKPETQFIICCNDIPKIADTTKGMIRRLSFIPFEMQLDEDSVDIMLGEKLISDIDNLRYIMTGGIFAYREAIKRGHLTEIEKQKDLINDFLEENQTPIDLFYEYLLVTEGNGDKEKLYRYLDGKTTEEIYLKYKEYIGNDQKVEIQKTFTTRFKRKLPSKIVLVSHHISGASFKTYTLKS